MHPAGVLQPGQAQWLAGPSLAVTSRRRQEEEQQVWLPSWEELMLIFRLFMFDLFQPRTPDAWHAALSRSPGGRLSGKGYFWSVKIVAVC